MVKEEIEDILSLWRARQTMDSGKNTFRFKKCFMDAANKDLQASTYGAAPKNNSAAGGRKKSGKRKGNPENAEVGELQLTLEPHEESRTQPADEAAPEEVSTAPYNLGLPSGGNCNMTGQESIIDMAAGGPFTAAVTQAKDVNTASQGGLNLDAFNLDPELHQIAIGMQPSLYNNQQSDFLQGGTFDNFLDALNGPLFPDELSLRLPTETGLNDIQRGGPISLAPGSMYGVPGPGALALPSPMGPARDVNIPTIGHAMADSMQVAARPGGTETRAYPAIDMPQLYTNNLGHTMQDNAITQARADPRPEDMAVQVHPTSLMAGLTANYMDTFITDARVPPRPVDMAVQGQVAPQRFSSSMTDLRNGQTMDFQDTSIQDVPSNISTQGPHNEVQDPLPNTVQDPPLSEGQNNEMMSRLRARPKKIADTEKMALLKRGREVEEAAAGANKKSKTSKQPAPKKAPKKRVK